MFFVCLHLRYLKQSDADQYIFLETAATMIDITASSCAERNLSHDLG